MPSRKRAFHEAKSDLVIGLMSIVLHLLLMLTFFYFLSINNIFLRVINRTLATTQLTYWAMTFAMHAVYGGFDVGRKKSKPVISAMVSGTIITDLVTYLQLQIMNVNENNNDRLMLFGVDFLYLMLCILVQILIIILFVRIGNELYFHFNPPRSCLIILGSPAQEADIRAKIGRYQLQWRVDDAVMYNVPDLEARIQKADIVFLARVPEGVKFALLKMCYDDRKDVMCKAQLQDIMLCNARPAIVDDAAFLEMEYNKSSVFQRAIKRAGDILISLFCLVLFSPFMLVIAILIHAEDGGPVIFRQSRLTVNGKTFSIRKFRTMVVNASEPEFQVPSLENDPRITRIGAFLRRWRLDELPQFLNILIGDMSLVGPRPEMMSNVIRYKMELPAFVYREKMKAGLTGYAQIEGRYNTSAEDKLMLDMMYIESFSVWLDVKLLLRTFTVLFKSDSTQGFAQAPTQAVKFWSRRIRRVAPQVPVDLPQDSQYAPRHEAMQEAGGRHAARQASDGSSRRSGQPRPAGGDASRGYSRPAETGPDAAARSSHSQNERHASRGYPSAPPANGSGYSYSASRKPDSALFGYTGPQSPVSPACSYPVAPPSGSSAAGSSSPQRRNASAGYYPQTQPAGNAYHGYPSSRGKYGSGQQPAPPESARAVSGAGPNPSARRNAPSGNPGRVSRRASQSVSTRGYIPSPDRKNYQIKET